VFDVLPPADAFQNSWFLVNTVWRHKHGDGLADSWSLHASQSLFLTNHEPVVVQKASLVSGTADVPAFDREALIRLCESIRPAKHISVFLAATWRAGVVPYEVDFAAPTAVYAGCNGEEPRRSLSCSRNRLGRINRFKRCDRGAHNRPFHERIIRQITISVAALLERWFALISPIEADE
jgi:uncharacterized protein YbcV (DUF1398 family)